MRNLDVIVAIATRQTHPATFAAWTAARRIEGQSRGSAAKEPKVPQPFAMVVTDDSAPTPGRSLAIARVEALRLGCGAGVPVSMPSALRSSSTSGQCTPWPSPMSSQFALCAGVASARRHDHASGTLITRPSTNRAVIVSEVTSMCAMRRQR